MMAGKKRKIHSRVSGGGKRKRKSSSKGKRPDVSRKKSEARFFLKSATKCTLGRFSKYQEVTDEIHACVYWMSRLMVHACHVMTLLVLQNEGALWCCGEENVGAEEEAVEEEAVEEDVNDQREKGKKKKKKPHQPCMASGTRLCAHLPTSCRAIRKGRGQTRRSWKLA